MTIENSLKHLESLKESYIKITKEMLQANNGNLYSFDLFILGIIKRSILLTTGFCTLVRQNNFLSAAPLIRLHLDNLLQMHAAFIVKNSDDFSFKKIKGEQTNNLKDLKGNKMTDNYLAMSLSEIKETSWVLNLYKETSKFVHISDKHILSVVEKLDEGGVIDFVISDKQTIPEKHATEAAQAMISITEQLFRYVYGWIHVKNKKS
ncbi:MAG: hypothetical protein PHE59_02190 [Patescibacteria group bacterium]|nr:hypothetical protein [Patescibacteria group bacterium]MDD5164870.1 hypothetical protein [Patescibacteria group bacterium]MDD5534929.1 hypothetical protein [Patescibacteria group bacterium]